MIGLVVATLAPVSGIAEDPAAAAPPAHAEWQSRPAAGRIEVRCGAVGLLFRESSQWTPGRIDYRDAALSTERSAYGTVFRLRDVGFIGTGHLEVEPEELLDLAIHADGERLAAPGAEISANESFRFHRVSRVRGLRLESTVAVAGDRLYERAIVVGDEATPLELVYHFMHAWNPKVGSYLAGTDGEGVVASGRFADTEEAARLFHVQAPVDWVAVQDPATRRYAVSRLLAYPAEAGQDSQIWNVPGTYRKYYLTSFRNVVVPAGFRGVWEMVTDFGESDEEGWEDAASALAEALSTEAFPPHEPTP